MQSTYYPCIPFWCEPATCGTRNRRFQPQYCTRSDGRTGREETPQTNERTPNGQTTSSYLIYGSLYAPRYEMPKPQKHLARLTYAQYPSCFPPFLSYLSDSPVFCMISMFSAMTGVPVVHRWFHRRVLLLRRVHPEHMWRRRGLQLGGSAVCACPVPARCCLHRPLRWDLR